MSQAVMPGISHVVPARACHMLSLERACHKVLSSVNDKFSNHCSQARFDVAPLARAAQRGAGGAPFILCERDRERSRPDARKDYLNSLDARLSTHGRVTCYPWSARVKSQAATPKYKIVVYGIENDLVHRYFATFSDHPEQHLEG